MLNETTAHPEFETFYEDHIRKLLLARGGRRYVSKGNYNVTRLEYLLKIFPTARFVIPVRDPVWHIASLMKQHELFRKAQQGNPRAVRHLQRAGHFEFGLDRRPINANDRGEVKAIQELWQQGREVEGWARYWNHAHGYVADRLEQNPALAGATTVVRFEELCRAPAATVRGVLEHCGLSAPESMLQRADQSIQFPTYYRPKFSEQDLATIHRHTGATAARFGLRPRARPPSMARAGRLACKTLHFNLDNRRFS